MPAQVSTPSAHAATRNRRSAREVGGEVRERKRPCNVPNAGDAVYSRSDLQSENPQAVSPASSEEKKGARASHTARRQRCSRYIYNRYSIMPVRSRSGGVVRAKRGKGGGVRRRWWKNKTDNTQKPQRKPQRATNPPAYWVERHARGRRVVHVGRRLCRNARRAAATCSTQCRTPYACENRPEGIPQVKRHSRRRVGRFVTPGVTSTRQYSAAGKAVAAITVQRRARNIDYARHSAAATSAPC